MVGTGGRRLFLKDALWGGGGTHRSWPGGRGGRPRAGGARQPTTAAWWTGGQGGGARARGGGCKGFGSGGVRGRDTGPRNGANFGEVEQGLGGRRGLGGA